MSMVSALTIKHHIECGPPAVLMAIVNIFMFASFLSTIHDIFIKYIDQDQLEVPENDTEIVSIEMEVKDSPPPYEAPPDYHEVMNERAVPK